MKTFEELACIDESKCSVTAKALFTGEWDLIYVYGGETGAEEIFHDTGFKANNDFYVFDSERFLVYKKGKEIIKTQLLDCADTIFYFKEGGNLIITQKDTIYLINKSEWKGTTSYYLSIQSF